MFRQVFTGNQTMRLMRDFVDFLKPGGQKGKATENSTDDFSVIEAAEDFPF